MDVFQWNQNFETGLEDIDQQHRHLVKVTNAFGNLLAQNEVNPADIEKVFAELVAYAEYHFAEEEKLMGLQGVDMRHISHQKREHQNFLQEVMLYQQRAGVQVDTAKELFEFLMHWLVCHILGSDMSMARQIAGIEAGNSAADSYLMEERIVDKSTALLLKSLNDLFQQVSNRNKQLSELNPLLSHSLINK